MTVSHFWPQQVVTSQMQMTICSRARLDEVYKLVNKLQQAGKIYNLQQFCGVFGCVAASGFRMSSLDHTVFIHRNNGHATNTAIEIDGRRGEPRVDEFEQDDDGGLEIYSLKHATHITTKECFLKGRSSEDTCIY